MASLPLFPVVAARGQGASVRTLVSVPRLAVAEFAVADPGRPLRWGLLRSNDLDARGGDGAYTPEVRSGPDHDCQGGSRVQRRRAGTASDQAGGRPGSADVASARYGRVRYQDRGLEGEGQVTAGRESSCAPAPYTLSPRCRAGSGDRGCRLVGRDDRPPGDGFVAERGATRWPRDISVLLPPEPHRSLTTNPSGVEESSVHLSRSGPVRLQQIRVCTNYPYLQSLSWLPTASAVGWVLHIPARCLF